MDLERKALRLSGVPSLVIFFFFFLTLIVQAQEMESKLKNIKWQKGPSNANLGNISKVQVPQDYVFADSNDTRLLMESMQNPPTGRELGFLSPDSLDDWFIVFEFDEIGYVKDEEKNSLDADAILSSIKRGTEKSNEERKKRGWPPLTVTGWEQKPHYDSITHNLEWATRAESEGRPVVNYNTRLLGRGGVMRVTLVADPTKLNETLPKFKSIMNQHTFNHGHKYTEFRQGDKIAKYGLTGLIVGGATAVAVKSGAFKWLWKLGIAVLLGGGAFLKKLFGRREA